MSPPPLRRLHSGHFAFMRALAQGLDERASWDRYLRLEGEHSDLRTVRRTVAWIRDAFAAAARREQRPGTARLILLDPERFPAVAAQPSLAEFAQSQGLEDFSEAEQIEAYEEAYPAGRAGRGGGRKAHTPAPSRRARVIERQLEALRWLESLVARDPRPGDGVSAWLNPAMAARLERAGLPTLFSLVERINGVGARWWAQVPGVGEMKAARIQDWLRANEAVLGGLRVGHHVALRRSQLRPEVLAAVVPPATALVPLEKFVAPAGLDGCAGRFRAPIERCTLQAADDRQAIEAWLSSRRQWAADAALADRSTDPAHAAPLSSTQRAYRKEAERLWLWAVLERGKALSSLTREDAEAYAGFLRAPPTSWCGPRHHQRWSPLWRPLEGPLDAGTLRQALAIARSLFVFLVTHGYVVANPFADAAVPKLTVRLGEGRALTQAQWQFIETRLRSHDDTPAGRRLRRAMRWLYATGLRVAELTQLRCADLAPACGDEPEPAEVGADPARLASSADSAVGGWSLRVVGRGGRCRQVGVPADLVEELGQELQRHGFDPQVNAPGNRAVPVLARFAATEGPPVAWSASGLYQAIKAFLGRVACELGRDDARQFRRASAHWLRHSHGVHALQASDGQAPLSLEQLQSELGHASAATTSMYRAPQRKGMVAPEPHGPPPLA